MTGVEEIPNLRPRSGKDMPYLVKRVRNAIPRYNPKRED